MNNNQYLLTVVLVSHNRPRSFSRLFNSICAADLKIEIIIVESSESEIQKEITTIAYAKQTSIPVRVIQFHEDTPVMEKVVVATKETNTKYFQQFCDDDTVCPETLRDRVEFLESNPDYAGCLGRQLYCQQLGADDFNFWFDYQGVKNIFSNNDPLHRINSLARNWLSLAYSTLRTSVARKAFGIASNIDPKGWFLGERASYLTILALGKINLIDTPALAISVHGGSISSDVASMRKTILSASFSLDYQVFTKTLAKELTHAGVIEAGDAEAVLDTFFIEHLAFWYLPPPDNSHPIKLQAYKDHYRDIQEIVSALQGSTRPDIQGGEDTTNLKAAVLTSNMIESAKETLRILNG